MTSRLPEPREADDRATEYPLGAESFAPLKTHNVSEPSAATTSIFVSGVQKELAEERRAVKAFIEGDPLLRRFFTVFLFEDLPAADARADAVYLDEVDRSALYVGLFADEYGFEDVGGVSPTEREFERATQQGKPRLIFVKGTDDRARHPKMASLVRRAGDQLIRRRFAGTPDLTAALYASLVEHLDRTRMAARSFRLLADWSQRQPRKSPGKSPRKLPRKSHRKSAWPGF